MKSNLTLIGMPGAGKSTTGIILAKNLGMGFIDTDVLIQTDQKKSLQQILDVSGHLALRAIEEKVVCTLEVSDHVIATGGSVVYSEKAMEHLGRISTVIFLSSSFDVIRKRIQNFDSRGIAKAREQSLEDLFRERQTLYRRYAEITVDCNGPDQERLALHISDIMRPSENGRKTDQDEERSP